MINLRLLLTTIVDYCILLITMVDKGKLGKTVRLRPDTISRIDRIKPRGQTYDGFISTIIDAYEQGKDKQINANGIKDVK